MAWKLMARKPNGARGVRLALSMFFAVLGALALPRSAHAQRELLTATGAKGQLALDQVSGFRAGLAGVGGVGYPTLNYYGPIGFAVQRYSEAVGGTNNGNQVVHSTTFWVAPSFDYFVIEHLSVGGMIEFVTTSGSVDVPVNMGVSQSQDLPTLTSFTIIPRVGYLFALGDRWGIWPRGGLGYVTRSLSTTNTNGTSNKDSFNGLVIDLDVGFLFRVNETFFLRVAPELGWVPGGSHSATPASGVSISADANYLQFSATGGIGVLIDL